MQLTPKVKEIISFYESDNPGTKTNLARILMHGKLSGTGRMLILPVDQGFEHGPDRSFAMNPAAYDPRYHYELAIEAGLSAYAAPLGMIEMGACEFAGAIPLILKLNSANSLSSKKLSPDQAITGSIQDALRLGCIGVGITIYPGSDDALSMIEEAREIIREAKSHGLIAVVWSYPRGSHLSKEAETAIDVCAYAAHIAALIGAHIIKVKPPTSHIEDSEARKVFESQNIKVDDLTSRIKHVTQACFAGKRLVVFSGGANKSIDDLYQEVQEIKNGGANGSIIGRNSFQRSKIEALAMLDQLVKILK